MTFKESLNNAYTVILEQDAPQDAAVPQPENQQTTAPTQSALPKPEPNAEQQSQVAPEGYVEMVRLLAKALTINLPVGEIDDIFTQTPITTENAYDMKDTLTEVIDKNSTFEDNPERLQNPHYQQYFQSITEKNYQSKFKELLNTMSKYVKIS